MKLVETSIPCQPVRSQGTFQLGPPPIPEWILKFLKTIDKEFVLGKPAVQEENQVVNALGIPLRPLRRRGTNGMHRGVPTGIWVIPGLLIIV